MGNINTSPSEYAEKLYNKFCDWSPSISSLKKKGEKEVNVLMETLKDNGTYELGIYLEDCLVNDEQFQKFTDEDVTKCVGYCVYLHYQLIECLTNKNHINDNILDDLDRSNFEEIINRISYMNFIWDGTFFYKWSGTVWEKCDKSDVCYDFSPFSAIFKFDLTLPGDRKSTRLNSSHT